MLPDLLEPTPRARLDLARLDRAADFAFASGGTYTEIDDCLDRATPAPSAWDPACFERALFVRELVVACFPIVIEGARYAPGQRHLVELISRPPADAAIARFRQEILRELSASPAHRRSLEQAYVGIRRLKELLGPKDSTELPAPERRRMEILGVARSTIDGLASGFEGAGSGLARLREFGREVQGSGAFQSVVSLLDLDRNLATIDVTLRVGADGALRSFSMVAVRENTANQHYAPPLARFWRRVVRAFRGYVLREEEVRDAVVDAVFGGVRGELVKLFQLGGDIEIYLASLGFQDHAGARGLEVCLPEIVATPAADAPTPTSRELEGLFNPHLLAEPRAPVPCSLTFERHDAIAIFTGPNSGGKTRVLQAVAIAQMLGQAGLFVPARRARLVSAEGMFVSLIEEARPDQREGRLGTELLRIREVFERLRPGGAVLLDELCSGTNPSEGQEIFELVTTLLAGLEPQAFITTHFLDFAARLHAETTDGSLTFFQVGLDSNEEPTYQFQPGVARSSLANKTAARLGVTREALLELVARSRRA
jgi:DNA mismatch repair protein MutS2